MLIRFYECDDKTQFREAKFLYARIMENGYAEYVSAIKACGEVDIKGWFRPIFDIFFSPSEDDGRTMKDVIDIYVQAFDE